MRDYYAIVNGVLCYKFMPTDSYIPERSTKTEWFERHEGDPSPVYWAPVENAQINYACILITKYFLDKEEGDPDGVYIINGENVDKADTNWR